MLEHHPHHSHHHPSVCSPSALQGESGKGCGKSRSGKGVGGGDTYSPLASVASQSRGNAADMCLEAMTKTSRAFAQGGSAAEPATEGSMLASRCAGWLDDVPSATVQKGPRKKRMWLRRP